MPSSLLAAAAFCSVEAAAQDALAPPPTDLSAGAATPRAAAPEPFSALAPLPATATPTEPPPVHWGPLGVRPRLLYRFLYGDGIAALPGQNYTTAINELDPGVLLEWGTHWTLDYTPTLRFYSNHNFHDTTDHSVALQGATVYRDWNLGLSQRYLTSSQPLVETGAQTDWEMYSTAANGTYHFNPKWSLDLGLSQNLRYVTQNSAIGALADTREWSTLDWLNCQFWPRFGAGVGVGVGYISLNVGPDIAYEQLQARINWRLSDKLALQLTGGLDDREFVHSTAPNLLNPIFTASVLYQPRETTTLSLNASRTVNASYLQSQLIETTDVNASLQQRFFKKFTLDLAGGYRLMAFKSTTANLDVNREDDGAYVSVRVSAAFLKRGKASLLYYGRDNSSNNSTYKATSNQVGFELAYRF